MSIENILMPQLGESVTEGTIEKWLVKPGDVVNKYDPIAEVVTDKVNAEIPSSFSGIIHELVAKEGETLPIGNIVCTLQVDKEDSKLAIVNSPSEKEVKTIDTQTAPVQSTLVKNIKNENGNKARYSPAVLKIASEHSIQLESVNGTGLGGRITRKDLLALIESGQVNVYAQSSSQTSERSNSQTVPPSTINEPKQTTAQGDIEIPVTSIRRTIANNMVRSKQEIPHAWMMMEVDVTNLVNYREGIKNEFKAKEGFNLTYFAFFIKAVAIALKEFPLVNSVWAGDKIIQKKAVNISIAVATEDSLFVPVIKNADDLSIKGIAKEITELSKIVRAGKLRSEHIEGGTFTVNNTGSFGSVQSMGIINYPQAAILQVESIIKRPVILNGGVASRDMVNLCLSIDHRILDGVICGKFLNRVKNILENADIHNLSVY